MTTSCAGLTRACVRQLDFLTHEACNEVQGYFIGRPAPIDRYADLIGRGAPLQAMAG
jgi:EAL domain-containing protein (putative c-di-GMP-specific phosphodiesterase class I)